MRIKTRILAICLILVALPACKKAVLNIKSSIAQTSSVTCNTSDYGSIVTNIKDSIGRPIPSARIHIEIQAVDFPSSQLSDKAGIAKKVLIPPGRCTLVVSKTGYQSVREPITIKPGSEFKFDVVLIQQ